MSSVSLENESSSRRIVMDPESVATLLNRADNVSDVRSSQVWYAVSLLGEMDPYPAESDHDAVVSRIIADLIGKWGARARPHLSIREIEIDGGKALTAEWYVSHPAEGYDWRFDLPVERDQVLLDLFGKYRWAIDRHVIRRALECYQGVLRQRSRQRYDQTETELSFVAHCLLAYEENQ